MSVPFKDRIHNGGVSLGFDIYWVEHAVTSRTWREKCLLIVSVPLESTAWTDAHLQRQVELQYMMLFIKALIYSAV